MVLCFTTDPGLYENLVLSVEAVEYTDYMSAEGQDTPPMSVLDMTLNNLLVRF